MEFSEVVQERFSCRLLLDQPVPADLITKIVAQAQRAPSWGNTQPWRVHVAAGEVARAIRRDTIDVQIQGRFQKPEVAMPIEFKGEMDERYKALFGGMNEILAAESEEARKKHENRRFDAFGAPVLAFVTVPEDTTAYAVFDAGAFVTLLCLAAADAGVNSCILASAARHPQVARAHLAIPEDEKLVIGIGLGYADTEARINRFRSARAPMEKVLSLKGF